MMLSTGRIELLSYCLYILRFSKRKIYFYFFKDFLLQYLFGVHLCHGTHIEDKQVPLSTEPFCHPTYIFYITIYYGLYNKIVHDSSLIVPILSRLRQEDCCLRQPRLQNTRLFLAIQQDFTSKKK